MFRRELREQRSARRGVRDSILTGVEPYFENDTDLIIEILGDCLIIQELIEIGQQTAGQ